MIICTYLIVGRSAILMHNPQLLMAPAGSKQEAKAKKIPTPEVEAELGRYVTEKNEMYCPSQGIKRSIVAGAVGRRIGKRSAPGVLLGTIFPVEERTLLLDPVTKKPIPGNRFEVDLRRVVVDKTSAVLRGRAKVWPWAALVKFEVDDDLIQPDVVEELGELAGRTVGVLDYRPQKSGWFGRYSIELVDPPKPEKKKVA